MWVSTIEKPFAGPIILLAGAFALILVSCTNSEAGAHKTALTKAATARQEKPIKLRYYGGPKSPMYPG